MEEEEDEVEEEEASLISFESDELSLTSSSMHILRNLCARWYILTRPMVAL